MIDTRLHSRPIALIAGLLLAVTGLTGVTAAADSLPRVALRTSLGDIVLELEAERAPRTVENFLAYLDAGFYDATIFHRVIDGFMVQGGGFTREFERKSTRAPIRNEADNGLRNEPGTIAMARTRDPHSATAQFFINLQDNDFLDHRDQGAGWGYTVFGRVVDGMDVVRAIGATRTGRVGPFPKDAPVETITILDAERLPPADGADGTLESQ